MICDGGGDDVFAEIGKRVVEQFDEQLAAEHVDSHGCQEKLVVALDIQACVGGFIQAERVEQLGFLGFLYEAGDLPLGVDLHDAQGLGVAAFDGDGSDRQFGPRLLVSL